MGLHDVHGIWETVHSARVIAREAMRTEGIETPSPRLLTVPSANATIFAFSGESGPQSTTVI
ncbi:hypothetical protein [Aquabacter spiritensis]|uniref:hypothetical protein n=1 Tax=Aquabacter spiritensis TaxID=933073 RepID=UPI00104F3507|nr:hypothetical protein [Aquabacter spiritensis]